MLLALPLLKEGELSLGAFFAYSFLREIFTSYSSKIFLPFCRKTSCTSSMNARGICFLRYPLGPSLRTKA